MADEQASGREGGPGDHGDPAPGDGEPGGATSQADAQDDGETVGGMGSGGENVPDYLARETPLVNLLVTVHVAMDIPMIGVCIVKEEMCGELCVDLVAALLYCLLAHAVKV